MEGLWQDIRYGVQMLTKDVSFAVIAALTLALGIGANRGIFSVVKQVLLQRLPVPHSEELVLLYAPGPGTGHIRSNEGDGSESFSYPCMQTRGSVLAALVVKPIFP
jgi:putative ABC transport system permease protein